MLSALSASSAKASLAVAPTVARAASPIMETLEDIKTLAKDLNPVIGYWNPLRLGEPGGFGAAGVLATGSNSQWTEEAFIGWLRQSEVKHGRIAMAGFVGFIVQSAGVHFPGNLANGVSYESIAAAGGPGDQWDAIPTAGKAQILTFIALLEMISESSVVLAENGQKHYMRGGKVGYFPPLKNSIALPHPVPFNLFDPFGFQKNLTPERKEKALLAEINNGRLAMLGIFGCVSATKGLIVPGLDTLPFTPYAGEYMAPFEGAW